MKLLTLILAMFIFVPKPAAASFWLKCKVEASLQEGQNDGEYLATITSAVITDGFGDKGSECMSDNIGKEITIELGEEVETPKNVTLRYSFYNGMGENGVVNSHQWEIWR